LTENKAGGRKMPFVGGNMVKGFRVLVLESSFLREYMHILSKNVQDKLSTGGSCEAFTSNSGTAKKYIYIYIIIYVSSNPSITYIWAVAHTYYLL
jgi:hypothetical protein